MEKYKNDYKVYYDGIINKVNKGKKSKKDYKTTSEDIYPRASSSGSSYYYYNRSPINNNKSSVKTGYINKYINRFIIRLILTFVIFLGAFSLKVLDNEETKVLYSKGKEIMSKSYGLENIKNIENTIKNLNIDYKDFLASIEEKYEKTIKDIKVFNTEE